MGAKVIQRGTESRTKVTSRTKWCFHLIQILYYVPVHIDIDISNYKIYLPGYIVSILAKFSCESTFNLPEVDRIVTYTLVLCAPALTYSSNAVSTLQ